MKPTDIFQALNICIAAKQPAIVWGAPGIGKSEIGQQLAASTGRKLFDIRASLLDPVDLRGLPHVDGHGNTAWAPPVFLPRDTDGPSMILLDEMNRAPGMVQNALLQLVLPPHRLGEYQMPDDCAIISCCNRESDGGGVQKMHLALANRFEHLDMEPDLNDWCKWAVKANIHPMVIAHLRLRPERLFAMETWFGGQSGHAHVQSGQVCTCGAEMKRAVRAFPSPRSWSFVSKITHQNPQNGVGHALFAGAIGEADAVEYSGTLRLYRELPSVDAILMNPAKATIPTNPAGLYAVSSALVRMTDVNNFGRVLKYMERLSAEYLAFYIQMLVDAKPDVQHTAEWTRFHASHPEVMS